MSSRLSVRVLAALAPALLLVPTAAHAEKVVTADAVGDASSVTFVAPDQGSDDMVITPAPDETATDITRTVVAHGNNRLSVTVHLRDLVLTSEHGTYVRVATPRGEYVVSVEKSPGSRAQGSIDRKNGRDVECRALRVAVDGGADTVAVSLPTSCVGAPRWVQVGVGVFRAVEPPADAEDPLDVAVFADDGHREGDLRENDVAKGPRVRRG